MSNEQPGVEQVNEFEEVISELEPISNQQIEIVDTNEGLLKDLVAVAKAKTGEEVEKPDFEAEVNQVISERDERVFELGIN